MFSSTTGPAHHIVIRKRVERRRGRSVLEGFAYLAAANGTFFRAILILLVIAVSLIVWGLGLVHFDPWDEVRALVRESRPR